MANLDSDDRPLTDAQGRRRKRDIVQFVAMRDHQNDVAGLAKALLAEVPDQLLSFTKMHKIVPGSYPRQRQATAAAPAPPPYYAPGPALV